MIRSWSLACALAAVGCGFDPQGTGTDGGVDAPDAAMALAQPGGVRAPMLWWAAAAPGQVALIDRSGRGKDAVPAAPAIDNRPAGGLLNGNPVLEFATEILEVPGGVFPMTQPPTSTRALETFVVVRDAARAPDRDWILHEGTGPQDRFAVAKDWDANGALILDAGGGCHATGTAPLASEPTFLLTAACDADRPTTVTTAVNGVAASGAAQFFGYTATGAPMQIGGCTGADGCPASFAGAVAEVYLVAAALDADQRARIASTLAMRWAVTLAADLVDSAGRVLWPDDPRWRHDVAAIVRDDDAGLWQRQASAFGTVLSIGAGQFASTNAGNTASFSDGAALVWGNDDGATFWVGGPPGARYRVGRLWRVVATGDVGEVVLRWYAQDSTGPERIATVAAAFIPTLELWVSAAPDLAGAQTTPIVRDGDFWTARFRFAAGTSYLTMIAR